MDTLPNPCRWFYLYNCFHLHRTLVYRSNRMILECCCTRRFHDSCYLQSCTHLCLKNKPSKFKGAGTRKDKHKHCKSASSVVLEEFHNKVVVWLLKDYTSTVNVTINTFFVLKLASYLLCINKKIKEPHIFNFGF